MFVALLHSNSHRLCFSDRILPRKRLGDSKCPAYFRVMPSILIDSASPDITYSGLQWQSGFDPEVHGGSFNMCRTDLNASSTATAVDSAPTMALTFSGESKSSSNRNECFNVLCAGTAIDFYGQPSEGFALNYTYDGSRSRVADTNVTEGVPGKVRLCPYCLR